MRRITEKPSSCCDCGRDLPIPRRSNKKRCDDCSHARDLKRTADWYAAHAQAAAKIQCEFRGGADLHEKYREKYRPASPCLGEFDRKNPREKYCDNCKPVARRWQQLQAALANYHADKKKAAKRALKNRLKRRKAQGRPVRILGRLYPCAYRKNRKRGEGCLGKFIVTSSAHKFCDVCQKHADADRAQKYRDDNHEELLPKYRAKGKTLRDRAAVGRVLEKLKNKKVPASWRAIVPLILLDPKITKRKAQAIAGTKLTPRQMTRIGKQLRVWLPSWPGWGGKSPSVREIP